MKLKKESGYWLDSQKAVVLYQKVLCNRLSYHIMIVINNLQQRDNYTPMRDRNYVV